jgi:hypothetical protein
MITIKTVEREINEIRVGIYEETKDMTQAQRNERLARIVDDAHKQFGFKRAASIDREKRN